MPELLGTFDSVFKALGDSAWIVVFLFGAILMVGVIIAYKKQMSVFKKYPNEVIVFPVRGRMSVSSMKDFARAVKQEDGLWMFEFKSGKKAMPATAFKHMILNVGGKNILPVIEDSRDSYRSLNFIEKTELIEMKDPETGSIIKKEVPTLGLEPSIDDALKISFTKEAYRNRDRFTMNNWIKDYYPVMGLIICGMFMMICTWILFDKAGLVADAMNNAAAAAEHAAAAYAAMTQGVPPPA